MRTFGLACLLFLVLLACSCGNVFVRGSWGDAQTINGTVSLVQLTIVTDAHGTQVQVTAVTFLTTAGASNVSFCGDQRSRFPLNQVAKASFDPGQPCSTLLNVVIVF